MTQMNADAAHRDWRAEDNEIKQLVPKANSIGSTPPIASAGPESVIRLIHKSWVASKGSTTAWPEPVSMP